MNTTLKMTAFFRSLLSPNAKNSTVEIKDWVEQERRESQFQYSEIPFNQMEKWFFNEEGNLCHDSGKFFTIEGLRIIDKSTSKESFQPIIRQPENGILGLLLKDINGITHILMQSKVEPGNIHKVQISPTVQATKSNYTKVHQGKNVPYVEYFLDHPDATEVFEQLQSEHGYKFYKKANDNIIVKVSERTEVPLQPHYKWFNLYQIQECLKEANVINMDARSVLSCLSFIENSIDRMSFDSMIKEFNSSLITLSAQDFLRKELLYSFLSKNDAKHNTDSIHNWLEESKTHNLYAVEALPLNELYTKSWQKTDFQIRSEAYKDFIVKILRVSVDSREISSWTQPIIGDENRKLNGLIVKMINGVMHALVSLCEEGCSFRGSELGPSLHNLSLEYPLGKAVFSRYFLNPSPNSVLYDQIQSEEGGRFFHFQNQYMIVITEDDIPEDSSHKWVTFYQLKELLVNECYLNIELRTLITCCLFH